MLQLQGTDADCGGGSGLIDTLHACKILCATDGFEMFPRLMGTLAGYMCCAERKSLVTNFLITCAPKSNEGVPPQHIRLLF
jgi:hypothetical protein